MMELHATRLQPESTFQPLCVKVFVSVTPLNIFKVHSGQFLAVFVVTKPDICDWNSSFQQLKRVFKAKPQCFSEPYHVVLCRNLTRATAEHCDERETEHLT